MDEKTKSVPSKFHSMCRLCLYEGNVKNIFSVRFGAGNHHQVHLYRYQNDDLPLNICDGCLVYLEKFHDFVLACRKNYETLKHMLAKYSTTEFMGVVVDEAISGYVKCLDENAQSSADKVRKQLVLRGGYKDMDIDDRSEDENESTIRKNILNDLKCTRKIHHCLVCKEIFKTSQEKKNHEETVHSNRSSVNCLDDEHLISCNFCGKSFKTSKETIAYQKQHKKNDTKYNCSICKKQFSANSRFENHSCSLSKSSGSNVKGNNFTYNCEVCGKIFKSKSALSTHKLKHGTQQYLCSVCGKSFYSKQLLSTHSKVHSNVKPFKCEECGKAFTFSNTLRRHERIHIGLRPFQCTICEKSFTQWAHLRTHQVTHSKEKPFSCSYCGKKFGLKGTLTVHVRVHTGETPFLCKMCNRGFHDCSGLKKHQRSCTLLKQDTVAIT